MFAYKFTTPVCKILIFPFCNCATSLEIQWQLAHNHNWACNHLHLCHICSDCIWSHSLLQERATFAYKIFITTNCATRWLAMSLNAMAWVLWLFAWWRDLFYLGFHRCSLGPSFWFALATTCGSRREGKTWEHSTHKWYQVDARWLLGGAQLRKSFQVEFSWVRGVQTRGWMLKLSQMDDELI